MFVLELSKPAGICLAAWRGDGREQRLCGYCICSRYDTVWHIMNVAVDPDERRHGRGHALLTTLLERVGEAEPRFTLEVRQSNAGAIALYERFGFRVGRAAPPLLPGQRRGRRSSCGARRRRSQGRLDDVPNAGPVMPSPS